MSFILTSNKLYLDNDEYPLDLIGRAFSNFA